MLLLWQSISTSNSVVLSSTVLTYICSLVSAANKYIYVYTEFENTAKFDVNID